MYYLLNGVYLVVGLGMSGFYAYRAGAIIESRHSSEKAPWWQKWHEIWFNFAGSVMGWLIGYWLLQRFSGSQNLGAAEVLLMLFAALGIVGYVPQTLNAIPGLLEHLSELAAKNCVTDFHEPMPRLSKADQQANVSANEARRRKEVALAEIREMERDQQHGALLLGPKPARSGLNAWAR